VSVTSAASDPPRAVAATVPNWLFIACGLSWGAALIHFSAAIDHVKESQLFVLFFVIVAAVQLAWGFLVCRRWSRRLVFGGAVLGLLVACVWAISRTTGVPIGPSPWHAEHAGVIDSIATSDELTLVLLVLAYGYAGVTRRGRAVRALGWAAKFGGVVLVILSSLALLVAGHTG
jgi:hypothetical protein